MSRNKKTIIITLSCILAIAIAVALICTTAKFSENTGDSVNDSNNQPKLINDQSDQSDQSTNTNVKQADNSNNNNANSTRSKKKAIVRPAKKGKHKPSPPPAPTPSPTPTPVPVDINKYPGGTVISVDDISDGYTQNTLTGTNLAHFKQYKNKLSKAGYKLYAENQIGDNHFATYTKGNHMIHFYFVKYSGQTRIIKANNANLPPLKADKEGNYEETITNLETFFFEGLGCIYKLNDGSFVLIDGGQVQAKDKEHKPAEELLKTLKALAPDQNHIVIRSWQFSHCHGDHCGIFTDICSLLEKDARYKALDIKSFVFNFDYSQKQCTHYPANKKSSEQVIANIKKHYNKAIVYKALTGQVFHYPGMDMEILYTACDMEPMTIGDEVDADDDWGKNQVATGHADGNTISIVSRFTSKRTGHSFLCNADTTKTNIIEMKKRYGSVLKSDICTIPHHGQDVDRYRLQNGDIEFYKLIDPKAIFFPCITEDWPNRNHAYEQEWTKKHGYLSYTASSYIYNKVGAENTYVSGLGTKTVSMKTLKKL